MDLYPVPGLADVPGFLTPEAAWLLDALARHQVEEGLRGDIAEIGVFYGRSTLVLGRTLGEGERLVACDTFEVGWDGVPGWRFGDSGPPEPFVRARWAEHVGPPERLVVRRGDSSSLTVADLGQAPRLVHVDGGHGYDQVRGDAALAEAAMAEHGVVVYDDLLLPEWPDVTVAVVDHLREAADRLVPFLVAGHKGLACRPSHVERYAAWARRAAPTVYPAPGHLLAERSFVGRPVLVVSRLGPGAAA